MILYFENLNLNGNLIDGLGDPIHLDSATNKKYVDTENIRQDIAIADKANKSYVDGEIAKVHIDTTPLLPRDGSRSMTGDLDINNNKILSVKNLNDHKVDDAYEVRVRDLGSVVNKEYLNETFLKVDKDGNYFDLKQNTIKNCEPYYDGLFDDNSLVSKAFVDDQINKIPHVDTTYFLKVDGSVPMTGNLDVNNNKIINYKPFVEDDSSQEALDAQSNELINFGYFHTERGELTRLINDVGYEALNRKNPDPMEDNIDMNNHRIKGLSDGNENDDAVNIKQLNEAEDNLSKYIDNEITDNNTNINSIIDQKIKDAKEESISSVNQENVFEKVMADNLFKEDDDRIKFISVINYNLLYQINTNTYLFSIEKDPPKSYSTRLSIDLVYLPTGTYTMVFEMKFAVDINQNKVSVNAVSGTLNQVNTHTKIINFDYGYYSRSIINFHKWVINQGIDDLDIDIRMEIKSSVSNIPSKTPINVIVYGVRGIHSDIPIQIWDRLYYYDDKHIKYEASIDMNGKDITDVNKIVTNNLDVNDHIDMKNGQIKNVGDGNENNDAVNVKQLNVLENQFITFKNTILKNIADISTINANNSYYYFTNQLNHDNKKSVSFPNITNSYPYANSENAVTGNKTYSMLRILLSGNYHIIYTDYYKNGGFL